MPDYSTASPAAGHTGPLGFHTSRQQDEIHPPPRPQRGFTPGTSSAGQFDIFEWHPAYLSCQRFFLDHAQHETSTQAVCALVNIRLPSQWFPDPIRASKPPRSRQAAAPPTPQFTSHAQQAPAPPHENHDSTLVSLVPFIRRLVVTGFDKEPVLHGFFGDDWRKVGRTGFPTQVYWLAPPLKPSTTGRRSGAGMRATKLSLRRQEWRVAAGQDSIWYASAAS